MKHKIILLTILFTISTHHHSYTAEPAISCLEANNTLTEDYKNYLRQQIDFYKNEPVTVASLIDMGKIITGNDYSFYIRDTQNQEGNTLLHIAVTKEDLPVIQDIFVFSSTMHTNAQGKSPLDLAIEKLHPKSNKLRNNNQIVILETIANRIAEKAYLTEHKIKCLQKIIALELACKDHPLPPFTFIPQADLLHKLIPNEHKINSKQFLTDLYKKTIDEITGNTFAHACVDQEDPDELFKLVCTDRISDAKNKNGLDPLTLALDAFRTFTTTTNLINTKSNTFNRIRCCYFILYYYYTKNSTDSCCAKHKMPKK